MKASLECLECFVRQALRSAREATTDPAVHRRVVNETGACIPSMNLDRSPAALSQIVYELSSKYSGNADPYLESKRLQNDMALALEEEMRAIVRASDDPLSAALHLSAAGNIIDLGIMQAQEINLRVTIEEVMRERFAVDHTEAFRESLKKSHDLLFLLDNAGEIVFDKILIETLLPYTPVTAVVKGGPIINDACREDAERVGLTQICEVIDNGGAFIGSPLDLVPEHFLERMRRADMIVAKGQGNYETVDDFPGDVFLILRGKCEVVARHMGVRLGQVGLISTRVRGM